MGNHCANVRAKRIALPFSAAPRHRASGRLGARTAVSAGLLALSVAGTASPLALAGPGGSPAPAPATGSGSGAVSLPLAAMADLAEPVTAPGEVGAVLPLGGGQPAPQPAEGAAELEAVATPVVVPAEAAPAPAGDRLSRWIGEAIEILQAQGVPVSIEDIEAIRTVIDKESDGDPEAVNRWDANARAGHPSKGLMQCTDFTFDAYKLPGHDDIFNPVDNIIAGVRYTVARYGGFDSHPGLKSLSSGGGYRGY
ncbi:transglycosylase SLT domain-containing protein [Amycolatopsis sacchari]|uniref:transglycosylase SLT domain-containing protein n=1 Tax=Amycolatopsis sacchari TaxID=115433 RepID=UPI001FE76BB0|nr:transglycosylase SLT domain-containing protein [Amycolatopsis sacchari]